MLTKFKLYEYEPDSSKEHIIAEISISNLKKTVDLNALSSYVNFLKKIMDDSNQKAQLPGIFQKELEKSLNSLNIKRENFENFLKIISGVDGFITKSNLFDLFKLSKYFEIQKLLGTLKTECEKFKTYNEIDKIIGNVKISKEEEDIFISFLDYTNMSKIIKENFAEFNFRDGFPASAILTILKDINTQDLIRNDRLFEFIKKSFNENFVLLPFLDFFKLKDYQKTDLFKCISEIKKRIDGIENEKNVSETAKEGSIEKEEIESRIKQLEDELSHERQQKKIAEDEVAKLKSEISKEQEKNRVMEDEIKKIKGDASKEQQENQKKIEDQVKQLKNEKSQELQKNEEMEDEISSLKDDLSKEQKKNQEMKDEISNLKDDLSKEQKKNQEMEEKIKSLESTKQKDSDSTKNDDKDDDDDIIAKSPSHISYKNKKRIQIFEENKKIVKDGSYVIKYNYKSETKYIKNDLDYSIKNTETIPSDDPLKFDKKFDSKKDFPYKKSDKPEIYGKIEVVKESTFAAAMRMKDYSRKVCVLNFASATQPGGGVLNGRNSQEECLARQSTLYFSLETQKGFYEHNKRSGDAFGTDYMIYSPNVIILRDDDDKLISPVKVSVISSVAVNCSEMEYVDEDEVYEVMKDRCRRILRLCLNKGNDIIVLGAFGCGVFQNSGDTVSDIFKELLVDEFYGMKFIKIVFAIKSKPNEPDDLYQTFKKTLSQPKKSSSHYKK